MLEGRTGRVFTLAVFVFFLGFLVRRAVHVPLTFDEAAAYLKFIRADAFSLFNFNWATNHFLATALARLFRFAGGDHELALRLPSLIGYGVYVWFSVLILRGVSNRAMAFAGLLLLNLNPYLLDYFALSRGYGLWLGFQMGMVYFLIRFIAYLRAGRQADSTRALSGALTCAIGAVLANVAALNVYLTAVVLAAIAFVTANRQSSAPPATAGVPQPSWRSRALPWVAAAGFSALVFSQDLNLSPMLYEHVAVQLTGLSDAEASAVAVIRTDLHNHPQELQRHGTSWLMVGRVETTGLVIQAPAAVAQKIETITTRLDDRVFADDVHGLGEYWTIHDAAATWRFESAPSLSLPRSRLTSFHMIINYHGGLTHVEYAIAHAGIFLLALACLALVMGGAGRIAARVDVIRRDQWRVLQTHTLWLAAFAGAPLYLLSRDRELGFGESDGLGPAIRDLVDGWFYGHTYQAAQITIALAIVVAAAIACGVALAAGYRRQGGAALTPALTVLSIIITVSMIIGIERLLLGSPYPMGRTALFIVPLCVLDGILVLDAIERINRISSTAVVASMMAAVIAAAVHFGVTANVTSTEDWPYDVDTKQVIADLGRLIAGEQQQATPRTLAVYWQYWPVAAVYARWNTSARIDVVDESSSGSDFMYVRAQDLPPRAHVIKEYPAADGVLAR